MAADVLLEEHAPLHFGPKRQNRRRISFERYKLSHALASLEARDIPHAEPIAQNTS
jgi:hypothetical protein